VLKKHRLRPLLSLLKEGGFSPYWIDYYD